MKKLLVIMMLSIAIAGALAPQAIAQAPAAAPQKPQIKDPAEYNAYVNAVQQTDPPRRPRPSKRFSRPIPTA